MDASLRPLSRRVRRPLRIRACLFGAPLCLPGAGRRIRNAQNDDATGYDTNDANLAKIEISQARPAIYIWDIWQPSRKRQPALASVCHDMPDFGPSGSRSFGEF
jgi:hypothetical protein